MTISPWIGVDLDGTLAEHYWPEKGPYECTRIGPPIPAMVERVRELLAQGHEVRIFTARVGPQPDVVDIKRAEIAVRDWCLEIFGRELNVTATKDYGMISLYDDRAVRVHTDTGRICCPELV